jgi:hypothetical protein
MKDRIKNLKEKFSNIQDIVNASNLSEEESALANYEGTSSKMIGAKAALLKELIADVFNTRLDGTKWIPNWKTSERKWWPWFDMDSDKHPSGVGFSYSVCDHWYTRTTVGSRLCFESEELSDLSVELYPEVYISSLTK